jgi:uncharacterized membrane protein
MSSHDIPRSAKRNIEIVATLERELLQNRSLVDRICVAISGFFGSLWFIGAHVPFFAIWILMNLRDSSTREPFDPFPFPFLGFLVGIEFIFLTAFVLMNQRVHARRQEQWSHLNLQLSMLSEQEATKNMQILDLICQRLNIPSTRGDNEIKELAKDTPVEELATESTKITKQSL